MNYVNMELSLGIAKTYNKTIILFLRITKTFTDDLHYLNLSSDQDIHLLFLLLKI